MADFTIGGTWEWTDEVTFSGPALTASLSGAMSFITSTGEATFQTQGGNLNLLSTAGGDVIITSNGSVIVNSAVAITMNGAIELPDLTNTGQANYLAYNSGTGVVSYASVQSLEAGFWGTNGNSGVVGGKVGTLDAQPWTIVYDDNDYIDLSAAGMILTAPLLTIEATASNITISASSGELIMLGADAKMNVSPSADTFTIGNAFAGNELIVNSNAITFSPDTFVMNTVATLHLGSGGAMDLGSGASIAISAPGVNINTDSTTNNTTIGNVLAGNDISLDSALIMAPNLGTETAAAGAPSDKQPAGWSTVIWNQTTKEFAVYVQS